MESVHRRGVRGALFLEKSVFFRPELQPTGLTKLLRRWINDVDSTSQQRRVPSGQWMKNVVISPEGHLILCCVQWKTVHIVKTRMFTHKDVDRKKMAACYLDSQNVVIKWQW